MHKIELKMLHYFLLMSLAALMIGLEFYFELGSDALTQSVCGSSISAQNPACHEALGHLSNKILLMSFVLMIVIAIMLAMFMKYITIPLLTISTAAGKINEGDLSQIVHIHNDDEIGQVAEAMNALTSNLQEVAAYTQVTCKGAIEKLSASSEELHEESIESALNDIKSLNQFMNTFKLLK